MWLVVKNRILLLHSTVLVKFVRDVVQRHKKEVSFEPRDIRLPILT